ncbi:MAG: sulfatase-like hydrolase/transferase, partial [Planctomycetota bacterium]
FDHFWGFYHQIHAHFYYPFWIWHNGEKVELPGNRDGRRGQYVDDFLHEKALGFIRASAGEGRPFFCYVPTIIPHVELAVPEEAAAPYRGRFPKVAINDPRRGYLGSDDAYAVYAGMISRLDRNVGEIVDLLRELGIEKNTLVIFTSDNGPQGGPWMPLREFFDAAGALRGQKGSLFEGGIRVPFIARWPGKIRAGAISDHIGAFWDMMPTFAELAGVAPPRTDGISIVPELTGRKERQRKHEYLYWGRAVRAGGWKAHRDRSGRWTLYDLEKDIGETTDVAADHPDVVARIKGFAAEAYTRPRKQTGSKRVGIKDYVSGERIKLRNAR